MAKNTDVVLTEGEAKKTLEPMLSLPSFPDVRSGLKRMKQDGFCLATLINSSQVGVKAEMEHAGLTDCFEQQLSIESVGRYKPHCAIYEWAASEMQSLPSQCAHVLRSFCWGYYSGNSPA